MHGKGGEGALFKIVLFSERGHDFFVFIEDRLEVG